MLRSFYGEEVADLDGLEWHSFPRRLAQYFFDLQRPRYYLGLSLLYFFRRNHRIVLYFITQFIITPDGQSCQPQPKAQPHVAQWAAKCHQTPLILEAGKIVSFAFPVGQIRKEVPDKNIHQKSIHALGS